MQEYPLIELRAAGRHWLGRTCLSPPGLIMAVLLLALAASTPVIAKNGEFPGAQGLHKAGSCEADYITYCDDRFDAGAGSCHMRSHQGTLVRDEGLAINDCLEGGLVTSGFAENEVLESAASVTAADFGQIYCGTEPVGGQPVEFCVVCDTMRGAASKKIIPGVASCVKIINDNLGGSSTGTCGAYSIAPDPGGKCFAATAALSGPFSDPALGFFISAFATDAGVPGAKDLTVCGNRSWECVAPGATPIASDVKLAPPQGQGLIFSPLTCYYTSLGQKRCR